MPEGSGFSGSAGEPEGASEPDPSPPPAPPGTPTGAKVGSGTGRPAAAHAFESGTRRRPVVFEEDDDLDVPDFLK